MINNILKNNVIRFVFIVCSYNNEENINNNLLSIIKQRYNNWHVIYINDCSTDNTDELFHKIVSKHNVESHFTYIKNEEKMGQMYNKYQAYKKVNDLDIVCILDGDDWLSNPYVLSNLNYYYSNSNYKIITTNYNVFYEKKILKNMETRNYSKSDIDLKLIRYSNDWLFRHLKTGYGFLFKSIPKEYVSMDNKWINVCTDLAEMFTISDLTNKIVQLNNVFYTYNYSNSVKYDTCYKFNSEERTKIIRYLKTLERNKFSLPDIYIFNFEDDWKKKCNMMKQMKIIDQDNYKFVSIKNEIEVQEERQEDETDDEAEDHSDEGQGNESDEAEQYENETDSEDEEEDILKKQVLYFYKKYNIVKNDELREKNILSTIFQVLEEFVSRDESHICILFDNTKTSNTYTEHNYIHSENIKDYDIIYLGFNNSRIYNMLNNNSDIFLDIKDKEFVLYGGQSIIISKTIAKYILDYTIEKLMRIDLYSWDVILNFIRINSKDYDFRLYFKPLFIKHL